ncbi:CinA family protein [Nocardioides campestrisoli]|uniref:CinA family protein n=1 Tax=Nocardioides campestrisoli TaxID=2736757 RepID=UPI0015E7CB4E|nr:CinA family protein [Nocardioides campestrisoli]
MDSDPRAARLLSRLTRRGETLAVAESVTGGRVAAKLTAVPGASVVLLGAVVSYATEVKVSVLGVPQEVVASHGVVSAECAEAMARGVRRLMGSTWGVATTGVAGPGRQDDQPPGTVYVSVAGPGDEVRVHRLDLSGTRHEIQAGTARQAIQLLLDTAGPLG